MNIRLRAAFPRVGRHEQLGRGAILLLGLFAYRQLFLSALRFPTSHELESWFFKPAAETAPLVIGVAGWLLWRRRARLVSLQTDKHRATALGWLSISVGLFGWAHLTRASDLLFPSLAAALLAFAIGARGWAGCRAIGLPALVLLLGLRIPAPLESELVWHLQRWTASGAVWVMASFGQDIALGDVLLKSGEQTFLVIETCSGLRGIQILTLVSLVVRELFSTTGARQWLPVLIAPWLGFAVNVVRVVAVVGLSEDPEVLANGGLDHTPQGLAVLISGTAILYGFGWAMSGRARRREANDGLRLDRDWPSLWRIPAAWLVVLGVFSVAVSPFPSAPTRPITYKFSETRSGWSSEAIPLERVFWSHLREGLAVSRRYERKPRKLPLQIVNFFVGFEIEGRRETSRLFSSKIEMPGSDWAIVENGQTRLWLLSLDADLAIANREYLSEYALVYSWRLRDDGIWLESFRSLLALESSPYIRERHRATVRLVTPLANDGFAARDRAKQTLKRFIIDFRDELASL